MPTTAASHPLGIIRMNPTTYERGLYPASSCSTDANQRRNISRREQRLSRWGGAALLLLGLKRRRMSGLLLSIAGGGLLYRAWTGHCHCYEALGIDTSERSSAHPIPAEQGLRVEQSITVQRSAHDLFNAWQDLENLPRIMSHLRKVEKLSESRSRWLAEGPLGQTVEWEAETISRREPEVISWRSLPGSQIDSAGSVRFSTLQNGRGTTVHVELKYQPPGGRLVAGIAWLLGAGFEKQLNDDLKRFKSVMEAGEAPTHAGQPQGT